MIKNSFLCSAGHGGLKVGTVVLLSWEGTTLLLQICL